MERVSKSQQKLLEFISEFINQHKFGPSYREIMRALDYKSVSTVAIHVNSLIAKGKLQKRGRSARSLEVVKTAPQPVQAANHTDWLNKKIAKFLESNPSDETIATVEKALRLLKCSSSAQFLSDKSAQDD